MATAVVTLEEARKAVAAESRKRNFKIVEQIPGIISGLAKEKAIFIFNVGPKTFTRSLGSLGTYTVPACPDGKQVSPPLKIDGVILERVATDMDKMANRYEEGLAVAQDILFIGRGYTPDLNMENQGLFICETPTPSKEQISEAKRKLRLSLQKVVDHADILEGQGKRDQIGEMEREAARTLGVTKAWLSTAPKEASECPACGQMVNIEAVKCKCGAVLDWEKAKIYFPQEYLAYKQAQAIPAGK